MGISLTSSQLLTKTITTTATDIHGLLSMKRVAPVMMLPQKSALAGVGSPMNPMACRSSRLNLARRSAEKAAMTKAT